MPARETHPCQRAYLPNGFKLTQLLFAGVMATVALLGLQLALMWGGLRVPDYASLYGTWFAGAGGAERFSSAWWMGAFFHLVTAVAIFPLVFDYLTDRLVLPNGRWLRGVLWGACLWLYFEAVVTPLAGGGVFSNRMHDPVGLVALTLMLWLAYGLAFESASRLRLVHELHVRERHPVGRTAG